MAPVAGPLGEAGVPRQGIVSLTRPVCGHGQQRCLAIYCAPSDIPNAASPVLMDICCSGQPTLRRTEPLRMTQAWVVGDCMTALRTAVTLVMGRGIQELLEQERPPPTVVTLWDSLISSPSSRAFFPSAFFAAFSYRFASSCPDLYSYNVFSSYRCSLDRCQLYRDSKW